MSKRTLILLATSEKDARLLEKQGEEIIGYAIAALLNTFSRDRVLKRVEEFGLSRATGAALLKYVEEDPEIRVDLSRRFALRAKMAGFACGAATGLAFVPSIPKIYVGMIAVGAVYFVFSLIAWRRYSAPIQARGQ